MTVRAIICFALIGLVAAGNAYKDHRINVSLKPLKTSAERISEHGYPSESHFTETSDGYVINLFRIPYSHKLNNQNQPRPAVLIQHGLFSCSESFLLNGPDNALAYNYADAGFDVWLGNARGNIYNRNNTKMSVNHPYFWDFSWHEIGSIDIAQMIDYILLTTGEEKLHYVGHSQGGTVYFVLMSYRPEYNDKIKTAHLLAPAVYMGNTTDAMAVTLAPYLGTPNPAAAVFGAQEFLPGNPIISRILDTACGTSPRLPEVCRTLLLMWGGTDGGNMNTTLLPQLLETHPAGISTSQGIHYMQSYLTSDFRLFDHGVKKNLKRYNVEKPPRYALEQITSALYVYYGLSDASVNYNDLYRLQSILPNLKLFYQVPDPSWDHLDFVFAWQVKEEINDKVIGYCLDYENST